MRLYFKTTNPINLRNNIIDSIENGDFLTWEILESDGIKYLKHTKQWGEKGLIHLTIDTQNNYLITEVLKFKNSTDEVKDFEGYYLGRFCELMFVNYANRFSSIDKK